MEPTTTSSFVVIFLLLFVVVMQQRRRKHAAINQVIKNKKKGALNMQEMLMPYIGKKCGVHTLNDYVSGVITEIRDGWMRVEAKNEVYNLNLDYVIRVTEKKSKEK